MATRPSGPEQASTSKPIRGFRPASWIVLAMILGSTVVWLRHSGRVWWCQAGDWSPWSIGIQSPHTSQHVADPYSFTHVLHGLLFYGVFWLVARRFRRDTRLLMTVALECGWEILENSAMVIDRYRQSTVALGYTGDSVINSLGDIASCGLGFLLAGRLPARWSIALWVVVEAGMMFAYRDNLFLNVLMLVHPFEAVKTWQMGH